MSVAPNEHLIEAQKLTADALVDLYEIQLKNVPSTTTLRFRDGPPGGTTPYKGQVWEHIPVKFSGHTRSSEEERSRPNMTIVNPAGLWNRYAANGYFDRSIIQRYRVLKAHLDASVNIYQTQIWYISRVTKVVTDAGINFELRGLADGPDQLLPVRKYTPDAGFPFVTLK